MDTPSHSGSEHPLASDRCAWYLRVSTPRQKLEHQREHVLRHCELQGIHIPHEHRFEDKEKRHRSAKRQQFQRLLDLVRAGQLDWILICSFDRWGVSNVDEFFEFRRLLIQHEVRLWSVVDQMNLTGITEGDYFRTVAMAIGATKYVEQMAEKNILKMIEMTKQGWAASGNSPYGTDLVCYPLHDLSHPLFRVVRMRYMRPHSFRILKYTPDSRVERDEAGLIVAQHLKVEKDEISEHMPLRDKKGTGYRIEPSLEADRVRAVKMMFEMYDSGLEFSAISRGLSEQGLKHYDKPFRYHGVETILDNPAYLGLPAWGKNGVGAYRILMDGRPVRVKRKQSDPLVIRKEDSQFIQPVRKLFLPMVPPELWQRVHDRLRGRKHTNPNYGKRRTRERSTHPLNGKLFCPDCDQPMVLGSSMPAQGKRGKQTRCFNCATYRKFSREQCHANTVGWDKLDQAIEALMEAVKDRIGGFTANPVKTLREESWVKECEFTKVLLSMDAELQTGTVEELAEFNQPPSPDAKILDIVFDAYNRVHARKSQGFREELDGIDRELKHIGDLLLERIPSETIKKRLFDRMAELERRKKEIGPFFEGLTVRADRLIEQMQAILRAMENAEVATQAQLLESFIEKVIPRFEVKSVGPNQKRRTILRAVEFIPRTSDMAKNVMPHAMEIGADHRGKDSSQRPEQSWPGTWTN